MAPEDVIYLGYVEKPHGLKGGFTVRVFSGIGQAVIPPGTGILFEENRSMTVTRCSIRDNSRINLTLEEIHNREDADGYRGCSIFIKRDEAERMLEFFPLYGFIGMEIHSESKIYAVVDIEPSESNPLLLVKNAETGFHVPLALVLNEGEIRWKDKIIELVLPVGIDDPSLQ